MSLLYSECIVFTDDEKKQTIISRGDLVKIKDYELYDKEIQVIGEVDDFDFNAWKEISIVDKNNKAYLFKLNKINKISKIS